MSEEIKIKKSLIFGIIGVVAVGIFLLIAFKNIVGASNNELTGELVRGGESGSNRVYNEGDVQVVNLGVANYNYDPEAITVEADKPVKIIGNVDQLKGCLRAFTIPQLGLKKIFKIGDNILEFTPTQKGTFGFSCSMGMGGGSLIVK